MVAFALSQTASAAAVVSFSVGMQAGVTAVNALLGLAGAMAAFRTLRPLAAMRGGARRRARLSDRRAPGGMRRRPGCAGSATVANVGVSEGGEDMPAFRKDLAATVSPRSSPLSHSSAGSSPRSRCWS